MPSPIHPGAGLAASGAGFPPGAPGSLRDLNRLHVIDALRRQGSASRSELVRLTGLSRTTITALVSDLRARGLIVERPPEETRTVPSGRGRRPILLRLNAAAGTVLGVDFGHRHVRVAVADLSSTVLAEGSVELDVDHDAQTALGTAVQLVEQVLADAGLDRSQLVGAGVGLPGPIDRATATVCSQFILPGWVGVRAGDELARMLGLAVEIENDANLGALAEASFGAGQGLSDVLYVKLASGIGSGLVLGGRLYRGAAGLAGELGHIQVRAEGAVCRCGNRGCLETIASTSALLALLRPTYGDLTVRAMLELSAAGDLGARRVITDAGHAVGEVLAEICNCLNPSAIVVGGDLSTAGEPLLTGIREAIERNALREAANAVQVKPAVLGERAEVLGALALVIGDTDRLSSAGLSALRQLQSVPVVS
jgi:predicted NBD/HSP70 family sugar kinase/biotin operon repressor